LRSGLSDDRERPTLPDSVRHLARYRAPQLRAGLRLLADRAANAGLVSRREVDAWAAVSGLYGRLERRERVAAATGVSATELDDIRRRVAAAVAAGWDERVFAAPSRGTGKPQLALARTHAETAALAVGEQHRSAGDVVNNLRDLTLGLPPRPSPAASPRERARRHRIRPAVLARLSQENSHPVTTPARLFLPTADELAVDADAAAQLRRPYPDPDWLAGLTERAQQAAYDDPVLSRSLSRLAVAGYAHQDPPPDRRRAAEAWRLAIRHDLPARDMAALWRLDHLRALLAEDDPMALAATVDVAIVLRSHGYLLPARRLLWSVLGAVRTARLSAAERGRLTLGAFGAFGSATPW
jgi:hypothetical protein